ncbi:MAG: IS91 family transposase, partial [Betaproteobacteria bacterium]
MPAPNSPLRAAATALAQPAGADTVTAVPIAAVAVAAATAPPGLPPPAAATAEPLHRQAARYAWALLLARIYAVLPLLCPRCGSQMRIIAFITAAVVVRDLLRHRGQPSTPPTIAQARGPPLWAALDAALLD